jgi:hypothetical protein
MLPTFVASTGTMPKNPCRQRPRSATPSLSTNKFSARFATQGETENNSPVNNVAISLPSRRQKAKKKPYPENAAASQPPMPSDCGIDGNNPARGITAKKRALPGFTLT